MYEELRESMDGTLLQRFQESLGDAFRELHTESSPTRSSTAPRGSMEDSTVPGGSMDPHSMGGRGSTAPRGSMAPREMHTARGSTAPLEGFGTAPREGLGIASREGLGIASQDPGGGIASREGLGIAPLDSLAAAPAGLSTYAGPGPIA